MERTKALQLIQEFNSDNPNLIKHMLAVEIIMRKLAEKFAADPEKWALAGLLHDLDVGITKEDTSLHGKKSMEILQKEGLADAEILHAIKVHPGHNEEEINSILDKALYCSDPVSGFIVACALMHPSKSISALDEKFLKKRFKEKRFARGAKREQIKWCEKLGMELSEFLLFSVKAMSEIEEELGFKKC
jgi:putative nucleotidyltransferase with HDIG domain